MIPIPPHLPQLTPFFALGYAVGLMARGFLAASLLLGLGLVREHGAPSRLVFLLCASAILGAVDGLMQILKSAIYRANKRG